MAPTPSAAPPQQVENAQNIPCFLVNNLAQNTEQQCKFIIENNCLESDAYFDYVHFVFCQVNFELRLVSVSIIVFLAIVLFLNLSAVADEFLCPSLLTVAKNLRMSDSLAGVTLLAFGNGCPDIFSSLAAASSGRPELIVGELLGSGIFCTSIVAGLIFISSDFKIARRPLIRDTAFYLLSVYLIWYYCYNGRVTFAGSLAFIIIYVIYLFIALSGQAVHSRLRGEYSFADFSRPQSEKLPAGDEMLKMAYVEISENWFTESIRRRSSGFCQQVAQLQMVASQKGNKQRDLLSVASSTERRSPISTISKNGAQPDQPQPMNHPCDHQRASTFPQSTSNETTVTTIELSSAASITSTSRTPSLQQDDEYDIRASPCKRKLIQNPTTLTNNKVPSNTSGQRSLVIISPGQQASIEIQVKQPYSQQLFQAKQIKTKITDQTEKEKNHRSVEGALVLRDCLDCKLRLPELGGDEKAPLEMKLQQLSTSSLAASDRSEANYTNVGSLGASNLKQQAKEALAAANQSQKEGFTVRELDHFLAQINPINPVVWKESRLWIKFISILRAPLLLLTTLTVPVVDGERANNNWCRLLNSIHCFTVPGAIVLLTKVDSASWWWWTPSALHDVTGDATLDHRFAIVHSMDGRPPTASTEVQLSTRTLPTSMFELVGEQQQQQVKNATLADYLQVGENFETRPNQAGLAQVGAEENDFIQAIRLALFLAPGFILALYVFNTTTARRPPRYHSIFAYCGFVMSVFWIYVLANEIISLLKTIGIIFSMSDTAIGLGFLAWGNSLGDIVANLSLAQAGYARMALGASIGAPLLNLLLGFGLSFILSLSPGDSLLIEYNATMTLLSGTLSFILVLLMLSTFFSNNKKFRKPFGYILIASYVVYFLLAVCLEYKLLQFGTAT